MKDETGKSTTAAPKKRPGGAKEWTAEHLGQSDEERKKIIEDTLKAASESVEAKKKIDSEKSSLVDDTELKNRISVLAKDPN
eukprot:9169800-Karenia_brevis.AAC.1